MSGSYESINYRLRPAKNIERKMLAEAISRLHPFERPDRYRYVGFGSPFFGDFVLFHRALCIQDMVSIEVDKHREARFRFNVPYRCVGIEFGHSNEVLARLDWTPPTVLWLDYDDQLDLSVLTDVRILFGTAPSGTLAIFSTNARAPDPPADLKSAEVPAWRRQQLIERFGPHLPDDVTGKKLGEWGLARLQARIIRNEIRDVLARRNGVLPPEEQLIYRQLFHFHYMDGARMLTVGGLIYRQADAEKAARCDFASLEFSRERDEAPFEIVVPSLTFKEIRELDRMLPRRSEDAPISLAGVPQEDVDAYSRVYRYFPAFGETDL